MQLPSNKVAATLTIVVLIVTGVITLSYVDFEKPVQNLELEEVELVVERKTDSIDSSNWFDNLAYVKATKPSESRGTLIGDLEYDPDSITAKASEDLLAEYLILKQKGLLTQEDQTALVSSISERIVQGVPVKKTYTLQDISTTPSSIETISIYGDRMAQAGINHFLILDSFKDKKDTLTYFLQLSTQYQKYAEELLTITVPTEAQDIHVELINITLDTKLFFDSLVNAENDPLVAIAIAAQYQAKTTKDVQLYTTLANYFKNNAIIFETESTQNFWNYFE